MPLNRTEKFVAECGTEPVKTVSVFRFVLANHKLHFTLIIPTLTGSYFYHSG